MFVGSLVNTCLQCKSLGCPFGDTRKNTTSHDLGSVAILAQVPAVISLLESKDWEAMNGPTLGMDLRGLSCYPQVASIKVLRSRPQFWKIDNGGPCNHRNHHAYIRDLARFAVFGEGLVSGVRPVPRARLRVSFAHDLEQVHTLPIFIFTLARAASARLEYAVAGVLVPVCGSDRHKTVAVALHGSASHWQWQCQ